MLTVNPALRPSASEILNHDWLNLNLNLNTNKNHEKNEKNENSKIEIQDTKKSNNLYSISGKLRDILSPPRAQVIYICIYIYIYIYVYICHLGLRSYVYVFIWIFCHHLGLR